MGKLVHVSRFVALPEPPVDRRPPGPPPYAEMEWVPGGTFQMGSSRFYPEEGPVHAATVQGFWRKSLPGSASPRRMISSSV